VEDKTLTTGIRILDVSVTSLGHGKSWTKGDGDNKDESSQSCRKMKEPENQEGIPESHLQGCRPDIESRRPSGVRFRA